MEVHSHTHAPGKKWTHYFWEFFMLFLAVSLGFLVENIRENYTERKKATEYALLLKIDLISDTLSLNNFNQKKDTELAKMEDAKKIFAKPQPEITIGDLRWLHGSSFSFDQFMPRDATLTQLNSSGTLRYFKNTELKNLFANYQWLIKSFTDLFNKISSTGGGLQSEDLMEYDIHVRKFIKKAAGLDSALAAGKAGYDFKSWDENNTIETSFIEGFEFLYQTGYPQLKDQATGIIKLLNKEYHLK